MDLKPFQRLNYYRYAYKLPNKMLRTLAEAERLEDIKVLGKFNKALKAALAVDAELTKQLIDEHLRPSHST